MKKNLKKYFLFFCLSIIITVFSVSAKADDQKYACEVLLCLSNPGSPTQYKACQPPIDRLLKELAKGHGVPTCIFKGSPGTYMQRVLRYFEDCPNGLTPYEMGDNPHIGYVAKGQYENYRGRQRLIYSKPIELEQNKLRACVGNYLDSAHVQIEPDSPLEVVPIYSEIFLQHRVAKPYFIDIYVNGVKVRSVNF